MSITHYIDDECDEKHTVTINGDEYVEIETGRFVCIECFNGHHNATEYSIPDCSVLACNCCCAG